MNHHLFGIDAWVLREESFDRDTIAAKETLFALGNGYLGIRGCHEELDASWWRGSYVNGFYESRPIVYGERAYGFADRYQTILNCSDATLFTLNLHGESFSPASSHIDTYSRELDLRTGILKRNLMWSPSSVPGTKVKIESRRLVPYQPRHLMLISYRVTLIEGGVIFPFATNSPVMFPISPPVTTPVPVLILCREILGSSLFARKKTVPCSIILRR